MAAGHGVEYASPSHPRRNPGFAGKAKDDVCKRGRKLHRGPAQLVGWSGAAYGDQSTEGASLLGYATGLMSTSLTAPCRILQYTSKFTGTLVGRNLGGEVYAQGEMVDHIPLLPDIYAPFEGLAPGMVGVEACRKLRTDLKTTRASAKKYLVSHFLSIRRALEQGRLGNVNRLPGTRNPAGGLTEVRSDMAPLSRIPGSGRFNSRSLRPLEGVSPR